MVEINHTFAVIILTKHITVRDVDSIERDIIQKQQLRTSMRQDVDR